MQPKSKKEQKTIKCLVWDLDNTLWEGVLLEDEQVRLREEAVAVIKELDQRGILHSVASKNDYQTAMAKIEEFGLSDYFLYPEISWNPKSSSIRAIAEALNIGLDSMAFVDDNIFERDEVAHELPSVLCLDALELDAVPQMAAMTPSFITPESALRRTMYQTGIQREHAEREFTGNNEEFLATLGMVFQIKEAGEEDLKRAEELTIRTNQLNTTGYTYSYSELDALRLDPQHLLLVASLDDKYGPYGTIGLALAARGPDFWNLKLLLMSCRVMSRGVGTIMLQYIMAQAQQAGAKLRAEFVPNGRNRMMYVTYKFAGFREVEKVGALTILENDLSMIQPPPPFVQVITPDQIRQGAA